LLVAERQSELRLRGRERSIAALFRVRSPFRKSIAGQVGTATAAAVVRRNSGRQKIVNYVGHGSPSTWRDNLLTAADALALTNTGRYPLFVDDLPERRSSKPQLNPLASALMNSREGGAIAVWVQAG